jgi:hypothetical protein
MQRRGPTDRHLQAPLKKTGAGYANPQNAAARRYRLGHELAALPSKWIDHSTPCAIAALSAALLDLARSPRHDLLE